MFTARQRCTNIVIKGTQRGRKPLSLFLCPPLFSHSTFRGRVCARCSLEQPSNGSVCDGRQIATCSDRFGCERDLGEPLLVSDVDRRTEVGSAIRRKLQVRPYLLGVCLWACGWPGSLCRHWAPGGGMGYLVWGPRHCPILTHRNALVGVGSIQLSQSITTTMVLQNY